MSKELDAMVHRARVDAVRRILDEASKGPRGVFDQGHDAIAETIVRAFEACSTMDPSAVITAHERARVFGEDGS